MIDDERVWISRVTRALILLPWAVPPIANGLLWAFIFNAQYGYLNRTLAATGVIDEYVNWLGTPGLAMAAVIIAYVWRTTPFNILLYHAALQGIPAELYEAADVDGASPGQRFLGVTLPLLLPVIAVSLVLRTTFAFMVFDEILAITQGGPGNATWVAAWYTYRMSFQPPFNIGLGAASAWVLALIVGAISLVYVRFLYRRVEPDGRRPPARLGATASALGSAPASGSPTSPPSRSSWRRSCPSSSAACTGRRACSRTCGRCSWAGEFTAANYRLILSGGAARGPIFEQVSYLPKSVERFPTAFLNSLIVGVAVTAATLVVAGLSAYAIARLGLRWTQALLKASMASRMIPLIVLMVPLYVMFRRYGLLNSLWGVIVAEIGFLIPYAVLILAPYFASLPSELEDAARIDGCTRFSAFVRVMLPLATPGLAACGVILFVISWHELLIPLIVVNRPELMTLPVVLAGLVSDYFVFFTLMMAICLLGLLPTVVLVLLLRRYIVRGLVAGALKG